jgi:hypothetical protein
VIELTTVSFQTVLNLKMFTKGSLVHSLNKKVTPDNHNKLLKAINLAMMETNPGR